MLPREGNSELSVERKVVLERKCPYLREQLVVMRNTSNSGHSCLSVSSNSETQSDWETIKRADVP